MDVSSEILSGPIFFRYERRKGKVQEIESAGNLKTVAVARSFHGSIELELEVVCVLLLLLFWNISG